MARLDQTAVYAQIVPASLLSKDYRVRILLPYDRDTTAADVRSSWGVVRDNLQRAIRTAFNEGATELPPQLEDCLAVEMTVPGFFVDSMQIDPVQYLLPDLQAIIIAAIKGRDSERRS